MAGKRSIIPNHDGVPDARGGVEYNPLSQSQTTGSRRKERAEGKAELIVGLFGVTDEQRERILERCRGRKYTSIRDAVERVTRPKESPLTLSYCFSMSGEGVIASATVIINDARKNGEEREMRGATTAPVGNGAVSAICKAIRQTVGIDFHLTDYVVRIGSGRDEKRNEDSSARVTVELECGGKRFVGMHCDADIIKASAVAVLDALNRYIAFSK